MAEEHIALLIEERDEARAENARLRAVAVAARWAVDHGWTHGEGQARIEGALRALDAEEEKR